MHRLRHVLTVLSVIAAVPPHANGAPRDDYTRALLVAVPGARVAAPG